MSHPVAAGTQAITIKSKFRNEISVVENHKKLLKSMLTANICLYMVSLRPFSKCWSQKMTSMAAECGYNKCSSYLIGFWK